MIIPTGFAQATIVFAGPNLPTGAATTIGFEVNDNLTPSEAAEGVRDAWHTSFSNVLPEQQKLDLVFVKYGPNATGPAGEFGGDSEGGLAESTASPQVAFLVKKVTDLGGRRQRGRMFIPGVAEADVGSDGVLSSGMLANLDEAADAFKIGMESVVQPLFLLHNHPDDAPTPIVALVADSRVATQRRRLRR